MSGNIRRTKKFWYEKLEKAFAEQEKLYKRKQVLQARGRGNCTGYSIASNTFFVHVSFNFSGDKAELIRLNQKLKQLKTTKLPYYWERFWYVN